MPLDRENGERFENLKAGMHVVIEPRILANMTGYKSEYTPKRNFMTADRAKEKIELPVFDVAVKQAIDAFKEEGALFPVRFDEDDVLVQVYPKDMKLAVSFQRRIAGKVRYSNSFFDLPKPVLDQLLEAAGKRVPAEH
jgi:hypothetical protein